MIKVLIVDDSPTMRRAFTAEAFKGSGAKIVGAAPDPFVARDMILEKRPDVLTLDVEMPRMNGIEFLRRLMGSYPLPVVIVSSLTEKGSAVALEALASGAIEVIAKPRAGYSVAEMMADLIAALKLAARVDMSRRTKMPMPAAVKAKQTGGRVYSPRKILAIGASTGGTVAIEALLRALPGELPGCVITQHMPESFTNAFATRLDGVVDLKIKEAETGDRITQGVVLIAPGDKHLLIKREGSHYEALVKSGPKVNRHRPSVDVMFGSVAQTAGEHAVGVILTGMGKDGAQGMLSMKQAGAHTIAQDEKSCVVFGMPKAAIDIGATDEVADLADIPTRIVEAFEDEEDDKE